MNNYWDGNPNARNSNGFNLNDSGYRGQPQTFQPLQNTNQQGSSSLLRNSLKKTIFGQQEQEIGFSLNKSRPTSRTMTPTHGRLRGGVKDAYGNYLNDSRIGESPGLNSSYTMQKPQGLEGQHYRDSHSQQPLRNSNTFGNQMNARPQAGPFTPNRGQFGQNQNQPIYNNPSISTVPVQQQNLAQTTTQPLNFTNIPTKTDTPSVNERLSSVVKVNPLAKTANGHALLPYFAEKRVVVTGASSGIGRAVAMWFLNSGAKVALIGRDLQALIDIGKQFPSQALVIKCDLSTDDQPYDMYNTVLSEFGGIDILVNAAGILKEGDIKNMMPQDYDNLMDVNIRSMFYLSFLFFPALQQSRGCIINVSCQYGSSAFAGMYAYCMSKAGVECLTKQMAFEFANSGVRVNAVAPGIVDTNLLAYRKVSKSDIEQIYSNVEKFTPLKRIATIDDVGKAIIFLCSKAASHITGQILKVDGGRGLTTSNWHLWEGPKANNLIMETKESLIQTFKGKVLAPSNIMFGYTELEKIAALAKRTSWATTDKEAHASIKYANYQEQDFRQDLSNNATALNQTLGKMFH